MPRDPKLLPNQPHQPPPPNLGTVSDHNLLTPRPALHPNGLLARRILNEYPQSDHRQHARRERGGTLLEPASSDRGLVRVAEAESWKCLASLGGPLGCDVVGARFVWAAFG